MSVCGKTLKLNYLTRSLLKSLLEKVEHQEVYIHHESDEAYKSYKGHCESEEDDE